MKSSLTSSTTKPSPKRLRSACNFCRRRKVRCDGGHPCAFCRNFASQPCTYASNTNVNVNTNASTNVRASGLSSSASTTPSSSSSKSSSSSFSHPHQQIKLLSLHQHDEAARPKPPSDARFTVDSSYDLQARSSGGSLPQQRNVPTQHPGHDGMAEHVRRYYNPSPSQYFGSLPLGLMDVPSNMGLPNTPSIGGGATPRPSSSSASSSNMANTFSSAPSAYPHSNDLFPWSQNLLTNESSGSVGLDQATFPLTEPPAQHQHQQQQPPPPPPAATQSAIAEGKRRADFRPPTSSDFVSLSACDSTSSVSSSSSTFSNTLGISGYINEPLFAQQFASASPAQLLDLNFDQTSNLLDQSNIQPSSALEERRPQQQQQRRSPPNRSASIQVEYPMSMTNSQLFRRRASLPLSSHHNQWQTDGSYEYISPLLDLEDPVLQSLFRTY